jgi:hypothetical protein
MQVETQVLATTVDRHDRPHQSPSICQRCGIAGVVLPRTCLREGYRLLLKPWKLFDWAKHSSVFLAALARYCPLTPKIDPPVRRPGRIIQHEGFTFRERATYAPLE